MRAREESLFQVVVAINVGVVSLCRCSSSPLDRRLDHYEYSIPREHALNREFWLVMSLSNSIPR